jgi:hypothetical protein
MRLLLSLEPKDGFQRQRALFDFVCHLRWDLSVSARASNYNLCSRICGDVPSCGFQDGQHCHTPPEKEQPASVGGHVLMVAGARAEEVADLVVGPAEPGS